MTFSLNATGRASLARNYRNLSEREIRARLEGPLSDAERVTAKAELLRRDASADGADTTFVSGFQPTSAMDIGAVESEVGPDLAADGQAAHARRVWPVLLVFLVAAGGAFAWAVHAKLFRF